MAPGRPERKAASSDMAYNVQVKNLVKKYKFYIKSTKFRQN